MSLLLRMLAHLPPCCNSSRLTPPTRPRRYSVFRIPGSGPGGNATAALPEPPGASCWGTATAGVFVGQACDSGVSLNLGGAHVSRAV